MKYYIDTEFIEGTQKKRVLGIELPRYFDSKNTIDLISIGIVSEDGREYYAISKDFNLEEAWNRYDLKSDIDNGGYKKVYWIRDNVLKPIWRELGYLEGATKEEFVEFNYKTLKSLINRHGKTNKEIVQEVIEFTKVEVDEYSKVPADKDIQFYGYYADYDWVVFCWIFGKMIDLPSGFPYYCIDLKQTLDEKQEQWTFLEEAYRLKYAMENKLFSTEIRLKDLSNYPKQTNEHSSIHDARWIKQLHEFLNKL